MCDGLRMPVSSVEMQEYLFSETLERVASNCEAAGEGGALTNWSDLKQQTRESFRFHRFAVMGWLQMNGVSIPAKLLTDQTHAPVGQQYPDQTETPKS